MDVHQFAARALIGMAGITRLQIDETGEIMYNKALEENYRFYFK